MDRAPYSQVTGSMMGAMRPTCKWCGEPLQYPRYEFADGTVGRKVGQGKPVVRVIGYGWRGESLFCDSNCVTECAVDAVSD